ncbi:uncharacterized protein LOC108669659 [Hyalella azteca]|uniref:Uncharacterized protein LOC108669659 n=1 Tax=Hyalella azteca TaxID=294128 RepID=A0A8B7NFZ5_HYAAZ|nr:uncharacterized protein LOC108669659 [Hyalella azteca]
MPNKKKNKPNAYFTFLQTRKPKVEKNLGRSVSYDEVSQYVGAEWARMSAAEKAEYAPYKTHVPLDSFGVPLYVHQEKQDMMKKMHEEMVQGIKNLVDLHTVAQDLAQLEFVVMAATDYITTEKSEVVPAEISLVRVRLATGLDPRQYHAILKPPRVWPLGYEAEMRLHVAATHHLPTDRSSPECVGSDDFSLVTAEMSAFLQPGLQEVSGGGLSPVFTLTERQGIVRNILSQKFNMCDVKVWSLEELLVQMYVALHPEQVGVYSTVFALDDITSAPNSPDFHPDLGCEWHRVQQSDEVNQCSLNMAQRWSFMFLQALRLEQSLGIRLVPNRHLPGPTSCSGTRIALSAHQTSRNRRHQLSSQQSLSRHLSQLSCSDFSDDTPPSKKDVEHTKSAGLAPSANISGTTTPNSVTSEASKHANPLFDYFRRGRSSENSNGFDTPDVKSTSDFPALGGSRKHINGKK